jgi:hypothetical protein
MSYVLRGRKFAHVHAQKAGQCLGVGLVSLFFCCLPLFSQTSQGTIQGGVFDQTGGAVAGATVSVIDVARGVTRALATDGAGQYVANDLTPGTYTVKATAKGFQTVEHNGVLVEVGQNIRVDLVVQPGEQTQTITVTGEIPAIDTTDATLGGTVSNNEINALPLNGRNFDRLLQLRPGVVTSVGGGSANGAQTNGRRNTDDELRVEGIAGMAQAQGSDILNATYRTGDADSLMPIDAIQEFNTEQNAKAEYGFRDGAIVNVGVKSGTNSIHGTAYAFGRDGAATDATNYFSGTVTPATLEQFGATAGGPVLKDKIFWFAGYEGLRLAVADLTNDTIPADISMPSVAGSGCTALAAGNCGFSMVDACNDLRLQGKAINPLSAQISGLNPATCVVTPKSSTFENMWPFTTNTATQGNYVPPITTTGPLNNGLMKGDYIISPHQHVSGMVFISKSDMLGNQFPGQLLPQWQTPAINDVQQYDGSWTWTPNSTWVNDFRMGYVYMNNASPVGDQGTVASNPWPSGYALNTGVTNPLYGGSPQIQISSFSGYLGTGNRSSIRGPEGDVDLVEGVSYLHGKHAFKFGFEYIDVILDGDTYSQAQGDVVFPTLENYLTGAPTSGTILLGDPTEQARSHWYGAYAQDDWRIKSRLTLNLGLRYEYMSSPDVRNNYIGNFNPNVNPLTTPAVEQAGPGAPLSSIYDAHRLDFSPRLGVAWDVQGNGKTVVRAGVGVYRNPSILKTFIGNVPFGANFPSLGVNNSGTTVNAHTPVQPTLTCSSANNCNSSAVSIPGELNWNLAGPIFPSTAAQVINGVTYTGATCTAAAPCPLPAVDPHFLDPYSMQWNLGIQRAITNKLTVDVAYVGNHGANEQSEIDLNQPPIGTGWAGTPTTNCLASAPTYSNCKVSSAQEVAAGQYRAEFPYFNTIGFATNGDISNYDALQATLQARGYHGLSFLAGYTYSHALSESDGNSNSGIMVVSDKNNLRLNYGDSNSDLRHHFTFSPTYAIPGIKSPGQMLEGWAVSSIVVLQSGLPWNPSDSSVDWLGTGESANSAPQYWNFSGPTSAFKVTASPIPCFGKYSGCTAYPVVGGVPQLPAACVSAATAPYGGPTTTDGQLAIAALTNTACYVRGGGVLTPPAYGTLGDAGRGIFTGQNYYNVDFSVSKIWTLKERFSAQFRAEFFNLFNRADFAGSSTAGGTAVVAAGPSSGVGGGFGYATVTPDAGNSVLGSGGPRHVQFGLKLTF